MSVEQKQFLEELSGEIDKKLFKGTLQNKSMVFDEDLKLIAPLRNFYNPSIFIDHLMLGEDGEKSELFDFSHARARNATVLYKGKPILDVITPTAFQLYDDWRIYPKTYHHMRFAGWTEMGPGRTLKKICSFFNPIGPYGDGSYVRVLTKDNQIRIINLPPYTVSIDTDYLTITADGRRSLDDGFIVDLTNLKRLEYCHPSLQKRGETTVRNVATLMNVTTDAFTRGGMLISFNARWM